MTPGAVVECFDVLKEVGFGFGPSSIPAMVNLLGFQGTEKTFGRGIVVTITGSAHTTTQVMFFQQCLVILVLYVVDVVANPATVENRVDFWHPDDWLRKGKRSLSLLHLKRVTSTKACAPCLDGNF